MSTATKTPPTKGKHTEITAPGHTHRQSKSLQASTAARGPEFFQQSAGNLAIQQLLNAGAIKAKLSISQPNDPDEQEADAVADRIMRMPEPNGPAFCLACAVGRESCSNCEVEQKLQTKELPGHVPTVTPRVESSLDSLRSSGQPLPLSTREFFEVRFGRDLNTVRIHDNAHSNALADAIGARAFTHGENIYFSRGEWNPQANSGRQLLAHELVHATHHGGNTGSYPQIHRQSSETRAGMSLREGATGIAPAPDLVSGASNPSSLPTGRTAARTNPEAAGSAPGTLTNEELLAELAGERAWLAAHETDPQRPVHQARGEALEAERSVRILAGQLWLAGQPAAQLLYTFVDAGNGSVVVVEDHQARAARGATPSAPVVTRAQLDDMLLELDIPTVSADAASTAALGGTGLYTNRPDYGDYRNLFAARVNPDTINTRFPGEAGEYFYGARAPNPTGRVDLNTLPWSRPRPTPADPGRLGSPETGDFPAYDYLEASGERVQIKTSLRPTEAGRFSYYREGVSDIQGRSPARSSGFTTFDMAVFALESPGSLVWPPSSPALTAAERAAWEAARQRALRLGRVAVNTEDVIAFRANEASRMVAQPVAYEAVINAFLAQQAETLNSNTYATLAQINAATPADRATLLARIAQRIVSTQIIPGGVSGEAMRGWRAARTRMGLQTSGGGTAPVPDVLVRSFPEVLSVGEHGYVGAGTRAARPGALTGGVGAVLVVIGESVYHVHQLPSGEQVLVAATAGTVGGGVGAGLETAVQARLAQTALAQRLATSGGTSLVRGIGGGTVAGPIASVMTVGTMAYYDYTDPNYNPRALDYLSGGGRAFVVGGLSGIATSALTFALFGATLGPIGFIVGLIIGVGLYLLTDHLIGRQTERAFRFIGEPVLGSAAYPVR